MQIGRVVGLWRYPVKSMSGEPLEHVDVSWHGFVGDRRWAFIRANKEASGFPWLTLRERPEMRQYRPRFAKPEDPNKSPTLVRTPDGRELDVIDPDLAAELGDGARVIKQDRGVFDTFPLSLITTQTIASLGELVGADLEVQRFRPNLLVQANESAPFPEDRWVGRTLQIGDARMRIDKRDQRCVVVNIDPATNKRDPAILKTIAGERASCLGVYGSPVALGRVAIGDALMLE